MQKKEMVPVEWSNQRVLTTEQVAQAYHTTTEVINQNFKRNKEQFVEGVHYFKLTQDSLRQFKRLLTECQTPISPYVSVLYLWTEQGCVRHCKLLNTKQAWDVFGVLEKTYFNVASTPAVESKNENAALNRRAGQLKPACVYTFEMSDGTIKIGITSNIAERKRKVQKRTGLQVQNHYKSEDVPREVALAIETACHETFAERKHHGEYFLITFDEARAEIERHLAAQVIEPPVQLTLFEPQPPLSHDDKKLLVELCGALNDSPLKEQLVRATANLIFGREIF